jgi:hypothetical protein
VWHLPQFTKRLELSIKPSNFGYNAYNQAVLVKIPNQIIPYLGEDYYIGFVDVEDNVLCFSSKKFSLGTNEVEYYVNVESIDDINYTSLFVYYDGVGVEDVCGTNVPESYVFDDAYIVNYLSETDLISIIGPNFANHSAALHQPICDTYAVKTTGGSTYVSCSISKTSFTLFFNCYLLSSSGYLVYFSSTNYVYVNSDGSLIAKINGTEYSVGSKLYFDVCSTFSITNDGSNIYIVVNGLTKLVIKQTFSISEIRLGGNGTSGYSVECYFFDLVLLPPELPLYAYYLHNTTYDNSNFFRESGYDDAITNGYLTHWPEVIFSGDEVIFRSNSCFGVVYSVSFNNGSSWYVSGLGYEDIFIKYFGSPSEFNTVLRLTSSSGTIDKTYIIKVNDFNQFSINYDVDFLVGNKKDVCLDFITNFRTALHDKDGITTTPVEYSYEGGIADLNLFYLEKPVEFSWGGVLGSGIISKTVEYCFDIVMDPWFDDVYIDFWLGELYQGYYINIPTYFTASSGWNFYVDADIDFTLANWRYFPHQADIIFSDLELSNKKTEVEVGKGRLMRFLSDVKASDMVYSDFTSSVFCSLSSISPDYFFDAQTISGSLKRYDSDVYCSLLDIGDCYTEVKLNTIVIENFSMGVDAISTEGPNFCFNVDVYDRHYGVTESGINIYMNTNIIVGNKVSSLNFTTISGGSNVSWCYNVSLLSPAEYIEVVVYVTNIYGDLNTASYFLRYGKRYYYNLYHIVKHEYETLIPMLMVAENNVNIFPSFSAESMYVRVENYKRKNLSASIFGVGLDRKELPVSINAITTNFYSGGEYKVRVECKDLSGNIMDPFEFDFTIRSDGL